MTRIAHVTDLHFGQERQDLVAPLAEALRSAKPELLVVSGDLTHRGRVAQFRAAMTFLQGIGVPFLIMPGNHDVPLFNLFLRFLAPFRNWRRGTLVSSTARYSLGPLEITAANTADPWSWRKGLLRSTDLKAAIAPKQRGKIGVLACHHPLKEPEGFDRGETKGARTAIPILAANGVQVVLSGHLHHWDIGVGLTPGRRAPLLMVQTGTALCGRDGETGHGFSVLDFAAGQVEVTPWLVSAHGPFFQPALSKRFRRDGGFWHLLP